MKKLISLLLCLSLLAGLTVSAFAVEDEVITGTYHYAPSLPLANANNTSRAFRYSDSYFTQTGYQYDHELAIMTMDLACSAAAVTDQGWENSNRNFIDLMQQCGFTDIDSNCYITGGSLPDSIGVNMASKQLGEYTLLAVAVRGHNYGSEWASNFTVGRAGAHQGFTEASVQVLDYIKEYIASYGVTGKIKIWLTGYSRSAITANLTAGAIDQGFDFGEAVSFEPDDLYCYTFEAPQGSYDGECHSELYYNIHNIINVNDLVALVSLSKWGHSRYGIDYRLPCRQLDGEYYYALKREADAIFRETEYMTLAGVTLDLIDDFHYLSLNPLTTLKKQNVTQIEFYDELLDLITEVLAPDRDTYVDNVQSDLRELGTFLFGIKTELPDVAKSFARKFLALNNLAELYSSLQRDNAKSYARAVALVEEMLMEALQEGVHTSYNAAQAKKLVHNVAVTFIKLFMASPDTVMTLLGNIVQILNAHFPEMGRVWLDVTPAEFFLAQDKQRTVFAEEHIHEADADAFHPAVPATCMETGSAEYYDCTDPDCDAKLDADGNELADITLPIDPEAHSDSDGDLLCDLCGSSLGGSEEEGSEEVSKEVEEPGEEIAYSVGLSVSTDIVHSLFLNLPLSCTYKLIPELEGASLKAVQYSLDGGYVWLPGTFFSIPDADYSFRVRILDSTGTWTYFTVQDGTEVIPD